MGIFMGTVWLNFVSLDDLVVVDMNPPQYKFTCSLIAGTTLNAVSRLYNLIFNHIMPDFGSARMITLMITVVFTLLDLGVYVFNAPGLAKTTDDDNEGADLEPTS